MRSFILLGLYLIIAHGEEQQDVRWESAHIRVMSNKGRRTRGTYSSSDESQVIQVITGGRTLEIRLFRDKSPPPNVRFKDGQREVQLPESDLSCHWRGHLLEGGHVALSSCLNPYTFSGVVITGEGPWLIRPASKDNENGRHGVPHRIFHPSASQLQWSSHMADVARVPLSQLEDAARLSIRDEARRRGKRDREQSASIPLSGQYWTYNVLSRTSRAPEVSKKWVEMAVFTDAALYKRMKNSFPNETATKLKDYAVTLINTMDLLYGHKSLGQEIGFRLVHVEVMKSVPKELDSNGGKAKAYLSSFCEYAGDQNVDSGLWDHALLLTGIDLHEEGLKSTAGLAWAGTMCFRYYSCSVAEGFTFGSAFIITHEIGHSLGMEHDGVGISEDCDRDKFIMSPTTGAGKITWSTCSANNLKEFMQFGTTELRAKKGSQSEPTCLSELVASNKSGTGSTESLPGQKYDAYVQCALGMGTQFKPYFQRNKAPFNNICWILYCGNGTHAVSTHPALEGTKCDKNKFCRKGECIIKT